MSERAPPGEPKRPFATASLLYSAFGRPARRGYLAAALAAAFFCCLYSRTFCSDSASTTSATDR